VKVNKTSSVADRALLSRPPPIYQWSATERSARSGEVRCMFTDCDCLSSDCRRLGALWKKNDIWTWNGRTADLTSPRASSEHPGTTLVTARDHGVALHGPPGARALARSNRSGNCRREKVNFPLALQLQLRKFGFALSLSPSRSNQARTKAEGPSEGPKADPLT